MQVSQAQKIVPIILPQAIVDNDDPAGARGDANPVTVDTEGYDEMAVYVQLGATDVAMTGLGLYSSDTAAASGADDADYTLDSAADFGGVPDASDDNTVRAAYVNLKGKPRRWILEAGCGNGSAGTFINAFAVLSKPRVSPNTDAERGLDASSIS